MIKKLNTYSLAFVSCFTNFLVHAAPAQYELEIIETPTDFKHSYPVDINNSGSAISALVTRFNYPIDMSLLDLDDVDKSLADTLAIRIDTSNGNTLLNEVKRGRFNNVSLSLILTYLDQVQSSGRHQKLGAISIRDAVGVYRAGLSHSSETRELAIFDTISDATDEYTYMNSEAARAINNNAWIVGDASSPYTLTELNDINWLVPEFSHRAYVRLNSGKVTPLIAEESEYFGGVSYATDISDSGYVVGYASVGTTTSLLSAQASCEANDDNVPENLCMSTLMETEGNQLALYKTHAYRWKVNGNGEVVEQTDLGIAIDDSATAAQAQYYSKAYAVNYDGVAVGESHVISVNNRVSSQATVFYQGAATTLIDSSDSPSSKAVDINDNGIVLGNVVNVIGFGSANKSFYYDYSSNAINVTQLDDFAQNADTTARAINNLNQIVGKAEKDSLSGSSVPSIAFLYDIATESIYDLNDYLACDTDLHLVEAVSINDDGVILARATKLDNQYNLLGEAVQDTQDTLQLMVKLKPAAVDFQQCDLNLAEDDLITRKGASISVPFMLVFFITFLFKTSLINRK